MMQFCYQQIVYSCDPCIRVLIIIFQEIGQPFDEETTEMNKKQQYYDWVVAWKNIDKLLDI